jgi:hypothetical protein
VHLTLAFRPHGKADECKQLLVVKKTNGDETETAELLGGPLDGNRVARARRYA